MKRAVLLAVCLFSAVLPLQADPIVEFADLDAYDFTVLSISNLEIDGILYNVAFHYAAAYSEIPEPRQRFVATERGDFNKPDQALAIVAEAIHATGVRYPLEFGQPNYATGFWVPEVVSAEGGILLTDRLMSVGVSPLMYLVVDDLTGPDPDLSGPGVDFRVPAREAWLTFHRVDEPGVLATIASSIVALFSVAALRSRRERRCPR